MGIIYPHTIQLDSKEPTISTLDLSELLPLWPSDAFPPRLCAQLDGWPAEALLLTKVMQRGSALGPSAHQVTLLGREERDGVLVVRVGVFFTSIIGGCNCADDPTPIDEQNEYAELRLQIAPESGVVQVELAD